MTTYRRDPATDPHLTFDEHRVPAYTLPDLLGDATTATQWMARRRGQLMELFAGHVYGVTPAGRLPARHRVADSAEAALDGLATRTQVLCEFGVGAARFTATLLLYLPRRAARPVPVLLGMNLWGNHSIHVDPGIIVPGSWMRYGPEQGVVNHRATPAGRGCMARRWPVEAILERGYGLATVYCGEFAADRSGCHTSGVHPVVGTAGPHRWADQWGCLGAWAWGYSRMLDYLATLPAVDSRRVIAVGHSRLGKAALWAAAQDTRFAMCVANCSGCAGASLFRHTVGERLHVLARLRPYWFAPRFAAYDLDEAALPVDQHMLLALLAPRPLYVASASADRWADPRGEFMATQAAGPAWELFELPGLATATMPPPNRPVIGRVSYHVRAGSHGLTSADWTHFLDAADSQLGPP